jgi:hypothetical protein
MHFVVVMKYQVLKVVDGTFEGEDLYIAQSCPEFAFPKIPAPFYPGRIFEMTLKPFDGQGGLVDSFPKGHSLYMASDVTEAGPLLTPAAPVPPSGLYERFSPLTLEPSGPLESAQTARLSSWLDVTTTGQDMEIVFRPEGRIHWKLHYGPGGLEHKRTTVDGEAWTESEFTYDTSGHLAHKKVTGAGVPVALEFDFKTGPQGELQERVGKWPSKSGKDALADRLSFSTADGQHRIEEWVDGILVRIDFTDFAGQLRRSEFGKPASGPQHLVLRYDRDSAAAITDVQTFQGHEMPRKADWSHPAKGVTSPQLALAGPLMERSEALLLFGAPITHSETGKGVARKVTDVYFKECKMNEVSALSYDPSDLVLSAYATCICGFCVEGDAEPVGAVEGRDTHWSEGPWLRLNGKINVTPDHRVMTPEGPRRAGELKVGDRVLGENGEAARLLSTEKRTDHQIRLGVNLRTDSGVFTAGGLRFESEPLTGCTP